MHTKAQQLDEKLKELIDSKEKELNLTVVKVMKDREHNAIIVANRHFDDTHIVWSSYNTGEERTSYVNFYNGSYDMTLNQAIDESQRRINL